MLEIPVDDFDRLYAIWDKELGVNLERIAATPCDLRVRLLSGSISGLYRPKISKPWSLIWRYRSYRPGRTTACGQRRMAVAIGMAERQPNTRAS